jgi:hypothetical protein
MEVITDENTSRRAFFIVHAGRQSRVVFRTGRYRHGGNLALQLVDADTGEEYATLSINKAGLDLAGDEFLFKTYSENEGLLKEMLRVGAVEFTGRQTDLGPVCRLIIDR